MLNNILKVTFLNNSISAYLFSALVFIVCILAIKILKYHILNYLKKWAEKTATKLDDFLIQTCEKTLIPLLYYGIIYISVQNLNLNPTLIKMTEILGVSLLTFFSIRLIISIISYLIESYWLKKETDMQKSRGIKVILPVCVL